MGNTGLIISSTDTIEGYEIQTYHSMISVRQTEGVGLVAEFFSSFSDSWGGRSRTLERKLDGLYESAMSELKRKASAFYDVNAIIGTKVDIDEISGNNSIMLMITITGTPVHIDKIKKNSEEMAEAKPDYSNGVPGSLIREKLLSIDCEQKLLGLPIVSMGPPIRTLMEAGALVDVGRMPAVVNSFKFSGTPGETEINLELKKGMLFEYLKNYEENELSEAFAAYMLSGNELTKVFMTVFKKVFKPGYETFLEYLKSREARLWNTDVIIASANLKESYTSEDIQMIKKICSVIEEAQGYAAPLQTGSFGRSFWICSCGKKVNEGDRCSCGRRRNVLPSTLDDKLGLLLERYRRIIGAYEEIAMRRNGDGSSFCS